jgi:uncharacterized protein YicC (UPF0701 family)
MIILIKLKNTIVMGNENYRRSLQSVGIDTFVKYYDVFKENQDSRSNALIKEAFKDGKEEWKDSAINSKAVAGKKLFQHDDGNLTALYYIIHIAHRVDDAIRMKAQQIWDKEEKESRDLDW